MVLFQLPYRTIFIHGLDSPNLSGASRFDFRLIVKLGPEEFFGDAPLTGRLRIFPPHSAFQVAGTFFGGIGRTKAVEGTRLEKFKYVRNVGWAILSVDGSLATIDFAVSKLDHAGGIVQRVVEFLPASFAAASTCAVTILSIEGMVNGVPLDVRFEGNAPGGESFSVNEINPAVAEYFDAVMPLLTSLPRKIVAAHRYLAQSFLLEAGSQFSYDYTGERVLNLCKALEALVPDSIVGDIDSIREFLKGWGLSHLETEVFASLKYLRSQLDSAHIAISPIPDSAHRAVARFIGIAEKAVQALLLTAVKKYTSDNSLYPERRLQTNEPTAVKHLAKYDNLIIPRDWAKT